MCGATNKELATRCASCGGTLQDRAKTLNLFSTLYGIWRFPDYTIRKILLAEHKNYVFILAAFEGVFLGYLFLFFVKAGDTYSIELPRLILSGFVAGILLFLPMLYLSAILSYLLLRVYRTGVTARGFIAGMIYSLHPLALSMVVILPMEIAVYGPYLFSNNPPPWIINPPPFYLFVILELIAVLAAINFVVHLVRLLFTRRIITVAVVGLILIAFSVLTDAAKSLLVK